MWMWLKLLALYCGEYFAEYWFCLNSKFWKVLKIEIVSALTIIYSGVEVLQYCTNSIVRLKLEQAGAELCQA